MSLLMLALICPLATVHAAKAKVIEPKVVKVMKDKKPKIVKPKVVKDKKVKINLLGKIDNSNIYKFKIQKMSSA